MNILNAEKTPSSTSSPSRKGYIEISDNTLSLHVPATIHGVDLVPLATSTFGIMKKNTTALTPPGRLPWQIWQTLADQVIAWDPSHSSSAFAEISAGRGRPQHLVFVLRPGGQGMSRLQVRVQHGPTTITSKPSGSIMNSSGTSGS